VIAHAREEYLFVYSVYVLEASTSNRLTHFYPPLNLIPLLFLRPLRLFLTASTIRSARIVLLKATHSPIVAAIWLYEKLHFKIHGNTATFSTSGIRSRDISESFSHISNGSERLGKERRQRPFLVERSHTKTSSQNYDLSKPSTADTDIHTPGGKNGKLRKGEGSAAVGETVVVVDKALEAKIDELSKKIEELTAIIMAGQTGQLPES
jgi:hypothetical protein